MKFQNLMAYETAVQLRAIT